MNCLQNLPRFCASPLQGAVPRGQLNKISAFGLLEMRRADSRRITVVMKAQSNSPSGSGGGVEAKEQKSDVYSSNMTQAMGAVLTYRHELGMNYDFIRPDLIVGSCLQTPEDVDKLRKIGVRTIFCLQQNSDLEYFSVDIKAIQEYAAKFVDIEHCRAEIRDFDAFDLRMRLPSVVKTLHKKINKNGGITYIHCTAGLGRAPAVTLAYMYWIQGYKLMEAHKLLLSKRSCFPKLEAIKGATADILTGLSKSTVKLMWDGKGCSSVEVAGLDIGWGQKIPLKYDDGQGAWVLEKELPEGKYEYKYVIDGDQWTCNEDDLMTKPNGDGHVNNYIQVHDNRGTETMKLRERLMGDDVELTVEERRIIRDFMDSK